MVFRALGSLARRFVRLLHALHLFWIARAVVNRLPPRLRLWISRLQVRLGYMAGLTLVPEVALQRSFEGALRLLSPAQAKGPATAEPAVYLEFGVFIGTSLACMARAADQLGASGLRIIGFDSFEGMPVGGAGERRPGLGTGELYSDLALTRANLRRLGIAPGRVELVKGWFDTSLTVATRERLGLAQANVVMIDCVIESATRTALDFILPLVTERTVIFFDDWSVFDFEERDLGEKAAFEAWTAAHPELVVERRPELEYDTDARTFLVGRPKPGVGEGQATARSTVGAEQ
ncbi:MAG TPA: class I SAM-dependent methyltransferase [Candidatus Limnocylindrales bacterium]|jgi:hypothetical protein